MKIEGNVVDVIKEEIYPAEVIIKGDKIAEVKKNKRKYENYLLPGFIDAHIHIESSMLCPSRFAECVVPHGTTSVITDPHEIANVLGIEGIKYMVSARTPLRIFLTVPSCVPATPFETSGAVLDAEEIEKIMRWPQVVALGEVMNFVGVINEDEDVIEKINIAKRHGKKIDGHAPLLSGDALKKYIAHGISTDHECTTLKEAEEKAKLGMKIMIREGSASKNMEALIGLVNNEEYKEKCFFVSDDRHPGDLIKGHMDEILRKAVALGVDPIKAIKMVSIVPSMHYGLDVGAIIPQKKADLVEVDDLKDFNVKRVFIDGALVARNKNALFSVAPKKIRKGFALKEITSEDLIIYSKEGKKAKVKVIDVIEDQIITKASSAILEVVDKKITSSIDKDVLKIAVVERYGHGNIGKGFIHGFSLREGAIASSVAHDSHNIVVVGTDDEYMAKAVNIVAQEGGLVVVNEKEITKVELPIAGLMSTEKAEVVCKKLKEAHKHAKAIGCALESPFMTLSFMALLVIPELKLSDKGLFDSKRFRFVEVIEEMIC